MTRATEPDSPGLSTIPQNLSAHPRETGAPTASARPESVALPQRPRMADGVVLAGQMQESAFEDPPWLIEREGQGYVQVTRLLYQVAEALDGRRSYAEIAERVSEASGRSVTADNVGQLVATQFIRRGLVPLDDGRVIGTHSSSRSLLRISMRVKALDAARIDPFLRLVQWLYWPPVLVLMLAIGIGVEAWLYLWHGIAAGIRDAVYAPAFLLATLAGTVVAAALHEVGHAAALRYGGGMPRAMGAGLYLVYPAFYTDVSDNYRLGRWARVRTDLGGFYFNLLFAIGVLGVYAATRREALLVIVSLVNLEVLRQLAPLMRLDGYWTLADLTGVPDFLSHMGAFLRSLVPGRSRSEGRLPRLKPWANVVFLAYIAIAIPLLALQLAVMLRGVPRLLATLWDSGGHQLELVGQAQAGGDTSGALIAALQLLALVLPALAVVVGLARMARRATVGLWRWSQPSAGRRVVAAAAGVGAMAFLAYAWLPSRPGASGPAVAPVTVSGQASYAPIEEHERGTLADVVAAPVPSQVPTISPTADVELTAEPAASPSAIAAVSATATPGAATPSRVATAARTLVATPGTRIAATAEPTRAAAATAIRSTSTPPVGVTPTRAATPQKTVSRTPVVGP